MGIDLQFVEENESQSHSIPASGNHQFQNDQCVIASPAVGLGMAEAFWVRPKQTSTADETLN